MCLLNDQPCSFMTCVAFFNPQNSIMSKKKYTALALFAATSAMAAPLTAQDILTQFNLVALGSVVSASQHVDGRSYVGGNLTGGVYAMHPSNISVSNYAGLTVVGSARNVQVSSNGATILGNLTNSTVNQGASAVLGNASHTNFNGPAYVGGVSAGNNFNGGRLNQAPTTLASATATDFSQVIKGLSSSLSQYASTGSSVAFNGNRATFNAVANDKGVAVFDLTAIDALLFGKGEFEFNLGSATTTIFNIDAISLNFASNFLGGSAMQLGTKAIWNFYNATDLTISNQFGGAILAPFATLKNSNNIEGAVLVNHLNQFGEIHSAKFTGNAEVPTPSQVPEPQTFALLALGLAIIFLTKRRRHA